MNKEMVIVGEYSDGDQEKVLRTAGIMQIFRILKKVESCRGCLGI